MIKSSVDDKLEYYISSDSFAERHGFDDYCMDKLIDMDFAAEQVEFEWDSPEIQKAVKKIEKDFDRDMNDYYKWAAKLIENDELEKERYERWLMANSVNSSRRVIKSDNENNSAKVPYEGSVYDFVKSKAKGKYKKLYPPENGWAITPRKPVCGVVRMFASDDVQKVLLQKDDTVLFVPSNPDDWIHSYVYVYVKIPDEFATELENKILNKYRMKDYLQKFYDNEGIIKCSEGTYLKVNGLCNGEPAKEDIGHVFQHYGKFGCLASLERFSKHCEEFFNETYYGGIGGIDWDLKPIFKDWVSRLWNYVDSQNYEERILEDYREAYDILQQAYEDERIAKEEAERVKQAEAEATTQSYIDWIEDGKPVYWIYGWAWKGARYNLMEPDHAISEIKAGKPFEIEYRTINGEEALVLQYVGENDLY